MCDACIQNLVKDVPVQWSFELVAAAPNLGTSKLTRIQGAAIMNEELQQRHVEKWPLVGVVLTEPGTECTAADIHRSVGGRPRMLASMCMHACYIAMCIAIHMYSEAHGDGTGTPGGSPEDSAWHAAPRMHGTL